jgi:hypothetical protein
MKEKASAHFARNDGRREPHRLKPVLPSLRLYCFLKHPLYSPPTKKVFRGLDSGLRLASFG